VQQFGARMVHDHTMTTDNLHKAIMKAGMSVPPPPPLRPDQMRMVQELQGMHGREFDRAYLAQQIPAHQEALQANTAYAQSGEVKPIAHAARMALPIIRDHLRMAQTMASGMGQ
jgi:putative membrane protein